MGVPKKRTSKMRRDRRRAANNKIKSPVQVTKCANCNEPVLPHRACSACGHYKGREVIAVD
ncbi:MAG: 50S ribosomal protein L32 [Deltaproteobacteria bacterium]|nr:50S ribosomal protein L32 [Deltaproteobacteria bacterium]